MRAALDIGALMRGYEDGSFTPFDVLNELYDSQSEMEKHSIWISLLSREDALKKAAGAPKGPLHGIPFAVKDNIDVAGLQTTCACPQFGYMPQRSAAVVALLEAAGAIAIGKTNLDQFATGLVGTRSPYGIPRNVFNSDYISGGSSSGSAVAVARGWVPFALGTDTAGSGRVPAGFNNIVGLKPTKGLISTRGVVPACRSQDTVSIFARTVADALAVAAVAVKFDAEDDFARAGAAGMTADAIEAGLRIGIPSVLEFFGDAEYERLYRQAVDRLVTMGAECVPIDFTPFQDAARLLYAGPWVAERLAAVGEFAKAHPTAMHDVVREIILGATDVSAVAAFKGFYDLAHLIRVADEHWQTMDVMLLPTAPTAYKIVDVLADPMRLNSNLGTYTNFVNLMDLAALAIPAGFRSDGVPFGVTLVGRAFSDGRLATLGDGLHRALGDVALGNTRTRLSETSVVTATHADRRSISVAVVGAHLSGQPLHWQLTERAATFVKTVQTETGYSLYALANTAPAKPGLVYDGCGTGGIEVEVWEMSEAAFGSFVALIPSPLCIGTIRLSDGTTAKGFLCEAHAVADAEDITAFAGWRAWLARD